MPKLHGALPKYRKHRAFGQATVTLNGRERYLGSARPQSAPRLTKAWADSKYHNHQLRAWMQQERPTWDLEILSRPSGAQGFASLPKRWVAERTFSWNDRCRRHSNHYERRTDSCAAMVKVFSIGLMLGRLAPANGVAKFNCSLAA